MRWSDVACVSFSFEFLRSFVGVVTTFWLYNFIIAFIKWIHGQDGTVASCRCFSERRTKRQTQNLCTKCYNRSRIRFFCVSIQWYRAMTDGWWCLLTTYSILVIITCLYSHSVCVCFWIAFIYDSISWQHSIAIEKCGTFRFRSFCCLLARDTSYCVFFYYLWWRWLTYWMHKQHTPTGHGPLASLSQRHQSQWKLNWCKSVHVFHFICPFFGKMASRLVGVMSHVCAKFLSMRHMRRKNVQTNERKKIM